MSCTTAVNRSPINTIIYGKQLVDNQSDDSEVGIKIAIPVEI